MAEHFAVDVSGKLSQNAEVGDDEKGCTRCLRAHLKKWRPVEFKDMDHNAMTLEKCRSSYYGVFGARIAIMLMLAILIAMVTILTWHFTTVYATNSIKSLAYSLRVELLKRTISRSWNLISSTLDATTTLVNLSDYMIARHYSTDTSGQTHQPQHLAMRNITWAVFASRQTVNTLSVLYRNGQLQSFERNPVSNRTFYVFSNTSNNDSVATTQFLETVKSSTANGSASSSWYKEELDPSTGQPIQAAISIPSFNLTDYAGDVSNLKGGETLWHVAVGRTDNESLLSSASDVRHPVTSEVMATVVVTSALSGVSSLMRDLARNYSGYFYLTSIDGLLLATSSNHSLVRMSSHGPRLIPAVESQDEVIRDGAKWLEEKFGSRILTEKEVHAEDIMLGGKKFYIDSFYWNLTGLPLVGVVLLPRTYVLGDVDQRGRTTLAILISVAACILIVGCLLILIFTSGVSTEMKLRAELIKHLHARQRAEASSNYKSQFLANMSHELRTPMAAVIGLLDILLTDACLSIEQIAIVSQIRHCSTALLRLLNNILDLSKVESGKLVLEKVDFNLGHELESVVDMFSVQCVDSNIDIILDLAEDMPQVVRGDLTRTVQIFANLIGNSIKFTSCSSVFAAGHIIIRGWSEPFPSSFEPFESSGDKSGKFLLWFEVEDSGCGIDSSKWETVFDTFVQADTSTSRTHGGTGLGLCIVRSLVTKMGGEIKVVKKESPGTLMRFYLLYDTPLEMHTPDNSMNLTPSASFPFQIKESKVLIGMQGPTLTSSLVQWVSGKVLEARAIDDWASVLQCLEEEFPSQTAVEGSYSKLLVILDTKLLPSDLDSLTEHLCLLNRFRNRGALFSWVLNHDTPASVKMRLRDRGFSIMANKPMYKSKLFMLLKSMIGTSPGDRFYSVPGRQWRDGIFNIQISHHVRDGSVEYPQDAMWNEKESLEALERLSTRMDYILGEVANHVHQKPILGDVEDGFASQNQAFSRNQGTQTSFMAMAQKGRECLQKDQPALTTCKDLPSDSDLKNSGSTGEIPIQTIELATEKQPNEHKAAEKASQAPVAIRVGTRNAVGSQGSLKGVHILLAEDTPVMQKVAVVLLRKLGATVVAVADGQAAVDAWKESLQTPAAEEGVINESNMPSKFDLILMDCQMPRMDGYDATKAIRKGEEGTGGHIPIVALTAHAMSSDEERCLQVGMDAYLTKPIDCKLMGTKILSLTRKKKWHETLKTSDKSSFHSMIS